MIDDDPREGPLSGIRVLDLATAAAGPLTSTLMGDFGAEVIKIEKPNEGDPIRNWGEEREGIPLHWQSISRNKKSITLDLRKPESKELVLKLCKTADVLIENFRPGRLEEWGLGPEELHKVNPNLIILRVTGYGQYGPYAEKPGFGTLMEAISGFAYTTGFPDGPPVLPTMPLADGVAGMYGAYSVMLALFARDTGRVNRGQVIDLALYEPLLRLLESNTVDYDQLGIVRGRTGNRFQQTTPRNAYKTKDGEWVAISGSTPRTAERVLIAIGKQELLNDPKFADNRSRRQNADELDKYIEDWVILNDRKEVIQIMESYDVAIAPVNSVKDVFEDIHFKERETIIKVNSEDLGEVAISNVIPKMSLTPGKIKWTGPRLGKHNEEIYCSELGMTKDEFNSLAEKGII